MNESASEVELNPQTNPNDLDKKTSKDTDDAELNLETKSESGSEDENVSDNESDTDFKDKPDIISDDDSESDTYKSDDEELEPSSKDLDDKSKTANLVQSMGSVSESNYGDSEEDDDSDYEDDYLKKLENNKDFIEKHHQEINNINYNVIEKLCNITRDENNNINDPYHRTTPILTKYEKTRILGVRTKQINDGCKPFISINEEIIDGEIIAKLELNAKKIPFIIKRPISNNKFEYWKLEDLEII